MANWLSRSECIERFGEENPNGLLDAVGGQVMYILRRPTKSHTLAKFIGFKRFAELCRDYGGEYVTFPVAAVRAKKDIIIECLSKNMTVAATAKAARCTQRYVVIVKSKILNSNNNKQRTEV